MKKNFGIVLAIALGLSALLLTVAFQVGWVRASQSLEERSGAPTIVSYQGQVWDGDTLFNGTGHFKFAILNSSGTTQYWSNDNLTPPSGFIDRHVQNGLFSVNLGDTSIPGMSQPLTAAVFADPNTILRVWFAPDGAVSWTQMPDQVIAAVPYALQAQYASDADKLDNKHGSAYQLRVSVVCPENYAFKEIDATGDGVCVPVEHRPVYSLTTVGDSGIIGASPSMAIGVDGLPLISFFAGDDDTHGGLLAMHCNTLDCAYYDINKVDTDSSVYVGAMSSLVIGQDGLGLIAYADGQNNKVMVAHCADVPCTHADKIYSVYNGAGVYSIFSISAAIGVDGYPLIGFIALNFTGNDLLYIAHCEDLYCHSNTPTQLYSADDLFSEISLTIGVDGFGLLTFHNHTTGFLRTTHCTNIACTVFNGSNIDTTAHVGADNSITIGTDGLGLIAYYSEAAASLKMAHCDNIACSTATSYLIDDHAVNIVGMLPSITIGSDGLGFIVYDANEGSNEVIKAAHCSDVTCSKATIYTIDNLGSTSYAGMATVTIGTNGLPISAYYNGHTTDLKVMHCSNNFCLPYVRGR